MRTNILSLIKLFNSDKAEINKPLSKIFSFLKTSVVLFFTVFFILLINCSEIFSQIKIKNGFYLGPMSHYFLNELRTEAHNNMYKELSFNIMQSYCAHLDTIDAHFERIGQKDGGFFEDKSNYANQIAQISEQWYKLSEGNTLLFEREKILRPCYGQRYTYQAEMPGKWRNRFPGFGYDSLTFISGQDVKDSSEGETIISRRCIAGRDLPGYIAKDLLENCSQTNALKRPDENQNSAGWERLFSDLKQKKYGIRWYIKPRMKAEKSEIFSHLNDTLVNIIVKNFKGEIIANYAIKGINFLDDNSKYNGEYIEIFHNLPKEYKNLSVSSEALAAGRTEGEAITYQSKVDFQVKWTGKASIWLDYVRVDDSWAHYLFTDNWKEGKSYDEENIWQFRKKIKEEVDIFNNVKGTTYFWVDEVQLSNLECIGEVNRLIKEYSGDKMSVVFITDPIAFMEWSGLKNRDRADQTQWDYCIDEAINCGALSEIMITQWFPFYYNIGYPEVLNDIPTGIHISEKVKKATNYEQYTYSTEKGVQNIISWLVRQHKYYINKAKEKNLIYGVINQLNSDENGITGSGKGDEWGLREPTNEEISMMLNISMAYGSKIILEFSYTSKLQDASKKSFNTGLTGIEPFNEKRDFNYYGQRKWDFIKELNRKLMLTGNVMYPAGQPNEHLLHQKTLTVDSVRYPCEDCGTASFDFIYDIKSSAPFLRGVNNCSPQPGSNTYYDCNNQRFWELGFFKVNPRSSNSSDKSKYLYAVNKRTYPVNNRNAYGDVRDLRIKFNPSGLSESNIWKIKDAVSGEVISSFNKTSSEYIFAGRFLPGEGKLLKISPAD